MTIPTTPLTGKGTIQKKKNNEGKIYYQVIRFPMYYDDDGNIVYERSPCFSDRKEAVEAQRKMIYKRKYAPKESIKKHCRNLKQKISL